MSDLALAGVFSGIDTDTIVAQLMAINQRPLQNLQRTQSTWQARLSALSDLQTQLTNLQNVLDGLRDPSTLEAVSVNCSDQDIVRATAGAGATPASHQIVVSQLARSERQVHAGLDSQDEPLTETAAQFVYTLGIGESAVTRTIQVNTETTLTGLRNLVNNDADNPGVTASILEYDDGSGLAYHLVLAGRQTGADYTITVEAATTLAGFGAADFERTQTAQDAWLKVDGYPSGEGQWVQRSSNTITDVIPGLTLTLNDTGEAAVTVTQSNALLREGITGLVDAYNSLLAKIDAFTGYDTTTKVAGIFQGDGMVNAVGVQIRLALLGSVKGFVSGSDPFMLAEQIGLTVDRDGLMELDAAILDNALNEHYEDVLAVIGANKSGATDSEYVQFIGAGSATQAGMYDVELGFNDTTGELLSGRIRLQGTFTWHDLDVEAATGRASGREDTPVEMLELQGTWDGQAGEGGVRTQTAEVRLRQGFAGAAYDRVQDILDATDGTLVLKKKTVQSHIDSLARLIERRQDRLEQEETRLKQKFARLEATLARLDSQRGAFEAMLNSLAWSSQNSDKQS